MIVLIKLILAHFLGDFLLQPKSWVLEKEKLKAKSIKFYLHVFIHGLLVLLLLANFNYWFLAVLVMFTHGLIDLLKLYIQKESTKTKWFLWDQFFHLISIMFLWILLFRPDLKFSDLTQNPNIWIYSTALLFITLVSGVIMRELMANWSKALHVANDESLINAGKYIGILERLFVFLFVITGRWEGIGFLLAAKSIFRFGDLKESKDRNLTEYILIGTLLSFGIAIVTGMLVIELVQ
jgi:hypothetical protein